jgi:hypothetical protein
LHIAGQQFFVPHPGASYRFDQGGRAHWFSSPLLICRFEMDDSCVLHGPHLARQFNRIVRAGSDSVPASHVIRAVARHRLDDCLPAEPDQ